MPIGHFPNLNPPPLVRHPLYQGGYYFISILFLSHAISIVPLTRGKGFSSENSGGFQVCLPATILRLPRHIDARNDLKQDKGACPLAL